MNLNEDCRRSISRGFSGHLIEEKKIKLQSCWKSRVESGLKAMADRIIFSKTLEFEANSLFLLFALYFLSSSFNGLPQ